MHLHMHQRRHRGSLDDVAVDVDNRPRSAAATAAAAATTTAAAAGCAVYKAEHGGTCSAFFAAFCHRFQLHPGPSSPRPRRPHEGGPGRVFGFVRPGGPAPVCAHSPDPRGPGRLSHVSPSSLHGPVSRTHALFALCFYSFIRSSRRNRFLSVSYRFTSRTNSNE